MLLSNQHTVQILIFDIFASLEPSKMSSVGKDFEVRMMLLKKWLKLLQVGDRCSCFLLAQTY